ncbi:Transmembrane transcriptional regulator (anti-sigma factor RsiW) [Noviherbaspirillum humi]|uniref:Transmembrane transcriptional regulator (Anti-sigma factor RsiW) n=1 Tax=Noviherbaspirillum humi TaxID=1688639 RepID=A0A239F0B9_9BURK|nr:anti-sigma factor [Noviherbaspirillum humi]SNS49602.1 Transmembrane transcriptional regulator (anti-sigma factor RsiW) [Noviherbaspirillum humi]
MSAPISEQDLHGYADDRLDAPRRAEVEAWLDAHPERREQVEAWRRQSGRLHGAYDAVLEMPVPARLMPAANAPRWPDVKRLAAVAWLLVGGLAGYLMHGATASSPSDRAVAASLPRMAAVAHAVYAPEVRHPVEVGADQEAHLSAWLSKRLGAPLKPPRLDAAGFHLVGGRLLPGDTGEVAQFMYEDEKRQRLTLYVQPGTAGAEPASFRYANENGIDVFYWIDGGFGYALSGKTGRDEMLRLTTLVYRQLNR